MTTGTLSCIFSLTMSWVLPLIISLGAWARPTPSPVSQAYLTIKSCFPALVLEEFKLEVSLDKLKEKIDSFAPTLKSTMRYRQITYVPARSEETLRLSIRAITPKPKQKQNYEMLLEKLDPKERTYSEIEIPEAHRKNPKPSDISGYIYDADVKNEEISNIDTKLKGYVLIYLRQLTHIEDLTFRNSRSTRTLTCENQKNLGVVCTCK